MRISSSFFKPIYFEENSLQHFIFQNERHLEQFRLLFDQFTKNKDMSENHFLRIDDGYDLIKAKDYHILQITAGELNLLANKNWQQKIFQKLMEQIEIDFIPIYEKMKDVIELNLDGLTVNINGFQMQLNYEVFQLSQLQKFISWEIKNQDQKPLTIREQIQFLLNLWISFSDNKTNIVVYHFPENDINISDMHQWIEMFERIDCTFLFITRSKEWLMHFPITNVHFIRNIRETYDLYTLNFELELIKDEMEKYSLSRDQFTISVAYEELIHTNPLLPTEIKNFINSSKY